MVREATLNKVNTDDLLKVRSNTDPSRLAGAIAMKVRENIDSNRAARVELQCIGAGAINQAVKGWAIAVGHLAPSGLVLTGQPSFVDLTVDSEERTGIKFTVTAQPV